MTRAQNLNHDPLPHFYPLNIYLCIMADISNEQDISLWMHTFYKRLIEDPITAPKFEGLNLEEHLPKIIQFWSFVLLDKDGYKTNVMEKHMHLDLEEKHFTAWITHFYATTNELFTGPKADLAKTRASMLASTFLHRFKNEFKDFSEAALNN